MVRAALRVTVVAAAAMTMLSSCWPPEFQPDASVNAPPYIKWESAFPAILPTQAFNDTYQTNFTVTVGDGDVDQPLKVRFCERKTTQSAFFLIVEKTVDPSPTGDPDRKPVSTDNFTPCAVFAPGDVPPEATRYLYVVVTDAAFATGAGCEVQESQPGTRSAMAAWPFTCDKPK